MAALRTTEQIEPSPTQLPVDSLLILQAELGGEATSGFIAAKAAAAHTDVFSELSLAHTLVLTILTEGITILGLLFDFRLLLLDLFHGFDTEEGVEAHLTAQNLQEKADRIIGHPAPHPITNGDSGDFDTIDDKLLGLRHLWLL